jgi:hypothetical protein
MFGKPGDDCDSTAPAELPGWMEKGASSVLWNGVPLEGVVDFVGSIKAGTFLRVTGVLALDCGHGLDHDCFEGTRNANNVEIHPVYSVEVFRNPAIVARSLTGMWAATDVGTYYIRQLDDTI